MVRVSRVHAAFISRNLISSFLPFTSLLFRGMPDYVSKPFNRLELLARISTQLRVKDAWREEVQSLRLRAMWIST